MRTNRIAMALPVVFAAFVASACGGGQTASPTQTVTVTAPTSPTPSETSTSSAPTAAETSPTPPSPTQSTSGDTFAFGDSVKSAEIGTTLTVSKPSSFTLSDTASCGGQEGKQAALVWTITIENTGSQKFDVSQVLTSVQSGNAEASQCFDSAQGINSAPSTDLMPGRTVSWQVVFQVAKPDDLVMQVNQDWQSDPIYFVS